MYSYREAGAVRRVVRRAVTARPVAWLSVRFLPALDRSSLRLTRGRFTFSRWVSGLPVVELTTTGARSGLPRRTFVLGVPEGENLLVIAANFGETRHPAWYFNVVAHPHVSITFAGTTKSFHAEELTGRARDEGFDEALRLNPGWLTFRTRAGAREIPVLRLTPAVGDV